MATVYLARQTDLDRYVALKELGAPFIADSAFAERFVRESRMAGSLSHTNIVTVHDYFEHDGTPYIAMEYLERGSLRPWVGTLELAQIVGVLEGLLAGLSHAEARGVVHRDLKPENVMVTLEGAVKIADFGIAKAYNKAATSAQFLTATGTAVGTPTYMAPEQAMAKDVGPWTDLYSTGVIAYELFLGRVPFHDVDTPVAILLHHVNERPPPPLEVDPTLDPQIAAWIERLMEKDPAARPQCAAEAWDELEDVTLRLLGPRWRRQARVLSVTGSAAAGTVTATPPEVALTRPPEAQPERVEEEAPPAAEPVVSAGNSDFVTYRPGLPAPHEVPPTSHPAVEVVGLQTPPPEAPPETAEEATVTEPEAEVEPTAPEFVTYRAPLKPTPSSSTTLPPPVPPVADVDESPADVQADGAAPEPAPYVDARTVPPAGGRPSGLSFEWPAATKKASDVFRGRRAWLIAGVAILAVAGAAVAVLANGGSSSGSHRSSPPAPEPPTPASALVSLASAGGAVYAATPAGRIARLAGPAFTPTAQFTDPRHPRSLSVAGGTTYVADDDGLTLFRSSDLTPRASFALPGASFVDGGSVVAKGAAGKGRLCLIGPSGFSPCVALGFAPTGLGTTSAGSIFVADGAGGRIVEYRRHGAGIAGARTLAVGRNPHGLARVFGNDLYVPVDRGIAVVDPAVWRLKRTIALPGTPSDLAFVPGSSRLFAALPSQNKVAVVDTASAGSPTIAPAGQTPVAVAPVPGQRSSMVAYASGGGSLLRLGDRNGAQLATIPASVLRGRAVPVTVGPPRIAARGRTVTVTIPLVGGSLDRAGLVVSDAKIGDGSASLQLWQSGLVPPKRSSARAHGLAVSVTPLPGRLTVALSSKPGVFGSMRVVPSANGRAVVATLVETPPVVHHVTPAPAVTTPQVTTTPPPVTPTPTPTPTPTHTTPPPPTITVG
jgi:tRNA A-37 threonylcarbamoyl transferase component Bud32